VHIVLTVGSLSGLTRAVGEGENSHGIIAEVQVATGSNRGTQYNTIHLYPCIRLKKSNWQKYQQEYKR